MSPFLITRILTDEATNAALRADVLHGLPPKTLPPRWLYDERGSELYTHIMKLPEYYPCRVERDVLSAHAAETAAQTGARTLIELGSGSSEKTRQLLDALPGLDTPTYRSTSARAHSPGPDTC